MKLGAFAFFALILFAPTVQAQTAPRIFSEILIDEPLNRTRANAPVHIRAILVKPNAPTDTALMMFRGSPGYAKIESTKDKNRNYVAFVRQHESTFIREGIALVVMDCPTDQWGEYGGPGPTNCFDDYRSSKTHADDVRRIMTVLREQHGLSRLYVLGHSQGTVSSRWMAKHLGAEIGGSIHSASMNVANPRGYGKSMRDFPYREVVAPMLHVHNEKDACHGTPYKLVQAYAGENLVTVRGGIAEGDPCGGGHLHSHQGREEVVAKAVIGWIKRREVPKFIGE